MMSVVLWQALGHSEKAVRNQFGNNDQAVLDILSGISRSAFLTEEYADLQPYLENLLGTSRIEQALLVDARGVVIASSRPDAVGKPPVDFASSTEHSKPADHTHFWRTREIRNGAGLLGVLAIEISDEAIHESIEESRNLGIGIALTGMVIIAVVGLVAGVLLTRRLATVTTMANRFARGDLTARTEMKGQDEIDQLGKTFDKMAESLQITRDEWEAMVQQLTAKNAQLERFAYTVSHDLKTPLVTVRGFAGMLEKDVVDGNEAAIRKDLEHILSGTDTMANLLEDLLKLSKIGHVVDQPQPVDLTELFHQAEKDLHGLIVEKGARIDIESDMPVVHADRTRLLEVAQNLLENSLKFSDSNNPVRVSVTAEKRGDDIVCCVADNGIGISLQYHEQIFGLFNRLDQSYEGTGIGLTLVKSIIEAHQGTVIVKSEGEGQGSKFYFTLPVKPQLESLTPADNH